MSDFTPDFVRHLAQDDDPGIPRDTDNGWHPGDPDVWPDQEPIPDVDTEDDSDVGGEAA